MVTRVAFLFIILLYTAAPSAKAQDARSLVQEGTRLSNAHNYAAAIEKYKAALAMEPNQSSAVYLLAFALQANGQGPQALPYLQQTVQDADITAAKRSSAYGLMAAIYDQAGQAAKAIESYRQAIRADSATYALQYGLGLAYFRNHQYAEAEQSAVAALQLDAKQADAVRLYALVTFHQNKRAAAFLGLCTFLQMAPNSPKNTEAYSNLVQIIHGGELKPEPGVASPRPDAANLSLNSAITQAVAATAKRRYSNTADKFSGQLQAVFTAVGEQASRLNITDPFFKQLADRYLQLAKSGHVQAFAKSIRQGVNP